MKLYVLRHGETDSNRNNISMGKLDHPLNEYGKKQARARREEIQKLEIDLVICSPKQRTRETAALAAPGIPIIYDERLQSRDHGEFTGKAVDSKDIDLYWNIKVNQEYERAETVKHCYERVSKFIDEIRKTYPDQTILLVTHSAIVRCIYYYFNEIPEDGNLYHYQSHTCSLEMYEG